MKYPVSINPTHHTTPIHHTAPILSRDCQGAVLLTALALLTATLAQAAAIEGIVLNGATNKPQPNATVTLFKLAGANGPEALDRKSVV